MSTPLVTVLFFVLVPIVALIAGAIIATMRAPGPTLTSLFQHFAAGTVFAALAGELLPQVTIGHLQLPVIIGFAIGVAVMLGMRYLTENPKFIRAGGADESSSMLVPVGIDLFIDGLLVGIGFVAGEQVGLLITVALTLEVLFLGLAIVPVLRSSGNTVKRTILITCGLGLLIALGGGLGATLLAGLSGPMLIGVLAFGTAALLYLVTEELLIEAHEVPETGWGAGSFFAGFLLVLLVEITL